MDLDDAERRIGLLEQAMDELERLSRAMQRGMNLHYSQAPRDGVGDEVEGDQ